MIRRASRALPPRGSFSHELLSRCTPQTSQLSRGRIFGSSFGPGTRSPRCCSSSCRRSSSSTSRCRPARPTTLPTGCSGSPSSSRLCSASSRAWAPEREGGALDGLVLAPCDRSAIWLGKTLAVFAFLDRCRARSSARIRALLRTGRARGDRRRGAREHRHLRRRLACSQRWRPRAAAAR